jgi:hypothetical protein
MDASGTTIATASYHIAMPTDGVLAGARVVDRNVVRCDQAQDADDTAIGVIDMWRCTRVGIALPGATTDAVEDGTLEYDASNRPGDLGRMYYRALAVVFGSSVVLGVIRWPHDTHLIVLGAVAFVCGVVGVRARRRKPTSALEAHIVAMGTSFVALLTAFYVDNGPQLPLWNRLPPIAFWILPTLIGAPIIAIAMWRHRKVRRD